MKKTTIALLNLLFLNQLLNAQTPAIHYQLNGNFIDAGSNKINGTAFGNPAFTTDIFGAAGKACEFDGVDDYIDLSNNNTLKPSYQLTMALWAHSPNWLSFTNSPTLAGNTEDGGYGLMINSATSELEAKVYRKNSIGVSAYALNKLNAGWHHFALTYNGGITSLFVDGKLVDTNLATANPQIQYSLIANKTIIGDESGAGNATEGKRFKGKIDDVRFYLINLNETQMASLVSATSSIFINDELSSGQIYPNPADAFFQVDLSLYGQEKLDIQLVDLHGKVIATQSSEGSQNIMMQRPSSVVSGLYFIRILQRNEIVAVKKISFK
jgi:hypothetical protein